LYGPRGERLSPATSQRGRLIDPSRLSKTYGNRNLSSLDRDYHQNIGSLGRTELMSLGRFLYSNFGPVRMALNQMACYASDDYTPSYVGADENFKIAFESWLPLHDLGPDISTDASMQELRRLIIISAFRDGDVGVVLTANRDRPKLQLIPAHRIGSRHHPDGIVQGGPYDGATIIDGVIVDAGTHRPLAYRVYTGDYFRSDEYVDIPVRSMRLFMASRDYIGQLRGLSALGGSAFSWHDIAEWERNELLAQRIHSKLALIRKTESGEADPMSDALGIETNENCEETEFYQEFGDGEIMYLTPNESVEAFISNRPTGNQREFIQSAIRSALAYMGFSPDFSFDATKIGGASLRVVAEQANRRVRELQTTILEPCLKWYYSYAVARNISREILPNASDFWRLRFMGSQRITADRRYDSLVDLQEMAAGVRTFSETTAVRGQDWKDVRNQTEREAVDLLERAQRLAESFDISMDKAMSLLGDRVKSATAPTEQEGNIQSNE
jgi:capsid protein